MPLRERLHADLPYLRRYARALTGSQSSGDAYVRAMLEGALADRALLAQIKGGRAALFAAFTRLWQSGHIDVAPDGGAADDPAQRRLRTLPTQHRQALLLTTLEDFSLEDTATILGSTADEVERLVGQGVAEIDRAETTSVLIIEDEPLISMQLHALIEDMGHTVAATAPTHAQAVSAFRAQRPGLVLADIQLADGSSGLDAVDEILAVADVPVIFITAYPEKLLTGERLEPTYLITKPFREAAVRTAISQALFFKGRRPDD